MPIIDMQRKLREAGRIRIGEQVAAKKRDGTPTTRPSKLDAFRFTSADEQSIKAIAELYGGNAHLWEGAPIGEQWEVHSETKMLNVIVPPVDLAFSQWYEQWSGGGCTARCDGQINVLTDKPCLCDPDDRTCKPTTRLGVIITELQGIGVWRLELHGWTAASELLGTIDILRATAHGQMVPARLMLEQRQTKREGKTFNYAVPVLDLNLSVASMLGGNGDIAALPRARVTPIQREDEPTATVAEQVRAAETPPERVRRSNAAATLPRTGLAPRPVSGPVGGGDANETELITPEQIVNLQRLLGKAKITSRADKLEWCSGEVGHVIASSKELTKDEGNKLISTLKLLTGEDPPLTEEQ